VRWARSAVWSRAFNLRCLGAAAPPPEAPTAVCRLACAPARAAPRRACVLLPAADACASRQARRHCRPPCDRPALGAAGAEGRGGVALVPVADMLDHDPHRHVAWHAGRAGDEDFQFIARAAVPQARAPRRRARPPRPAAAPGRRAGRRAARPVPHRSGSHGGGGPGG